MVQMYWEVDNLLVITYLFLSSTLPVDLVLLSFD
jgi:carbon starvation protein CstA